MALLPVDTTLHTILDAVVPLPPVDLPLRQALRCILAEPAVALLDQPASDNSAMDGYAVRASDVATASASSPIALHVVGESRAGVPFRGALGAGEAVRIFTGALVPRGADAVVMQENTRRPEEARVEVLEPSPLGRHIRRRGEEFHAGEPLLPAGHRVGPATLGLLGKAGLGRIRVHRRPRVCILGTGDELVDPADAVGRPEAVVDSNGAMLEAGCLEENAEVLCVERAPDSVEAVAAWLRGALERADVILTTGGASVGDHDVIAEAWEAAGIRTELWKVAMKPGKPVRFGRPSSGSALCFALPGNPLSALSGFDLFVRATLTELQGARWLPRPRLRLPANEPLRNKGSRRTYLRADLVATPEGPRIAIPPLQGSHMLRSAAALPLVAVLPEGPLEIPVGAPLDAFVVGEGLRGWVLEPLEGPGGDG